MFSKDQLLHDRINEIKEKILNEQNKVILKIYMSHIEYLESLCV